MAEYSLGKGEISVQLRVEAPCPHGEMDHHAPLRTVSSGFESWWGYYRSMAPVRILKGFLRPEEKKILMDIAAGKHQDWWPCGTPNWQPGRQNTGYEKLPLRDRFAALPLVVRSAREVGVHDDFWDCYILRYPDKGFIPPHVDQETMGHKKHARLNAVLQSPKAGGILKIENEVVELEELDAVLFYPGFSVHEVSPVEGERLLWSLGAWI